MGSSQLKDLIESGADKVINIDDLRIQQFDNGVLNVRLRNESKEFLQGHLDTFRKLLAEAGYRDYESWVATQGASWLNSGMFAGVSVRITAL